MAEVGCLKDGHFQNLQVEENINTGGVSSKYLDFLGGSCKNLTGTGRTIGAAAVAAASASGNTAAETLACLITANALSTTDFDAAAAGEVFLPPAIANTHCALRFTADVDGGTGALTIRATEAVAPTGGVATTGKFAFGIIGPNYPGTVTAPQSVITAGSAASPESVNLIYTPASAQTNCIATGTIMHFYCKDEGEWLVNIENVAKGTGATGVFTVSSS